MNEMVNMGNLNLPGYLQGKQFDYDISEYQTAQWMVAAMMPLISMMPLAAIISRCGEDIQILKKAVEKMEFTS